MAFKFSFSKINDHSRSRQAPKRKSIPEAKNVRPSVRLPVRTQTNKTRMETNSEKFANNNNTSNDDKCLWLKTNPHLTSQRTRRDLNAVARTWPRMNYWNFHRDDSQARHDNSAPHTHSTRKVLCLWLIPFRAIKEITRLCNKNWILIRSQSQQDFFAYKSKAVEKRPFARWAIRWRSRKRIHGGGVGWLTDYLLVWKCQQITSTRRRRKKGETEQ